MHSNKSNNLASVEPRLQSLRVQGSSYGVPIKIVYGMQRISDEILYTNDFTAVPHQSTTTQGGKGGGGGQSSTTTTYTYTTLALLALCEGPIGGVFAVWDTKGKHPVNANTVENFVIPATPFQVTVAHAANFFYDFGVAVSTPYSVVANDYGDLIKGSHTLSGNQFVPMTLVTSAPGPGQYSVSAGGVYTFNVADVGKSIRITYVWISPTSGGNGQPLGQFGLTLFKGLRPATTWSTFTAKHPADALAYTGLAYVANSAIDLGSSGTLPNLSFEVLGFKPFGGGTVDCNPKDIVTDLLTSNLYGPAIPSGHLDAFTQWSNACVANGKFLSMAIEEQVELADVLKELALATNAELVWSGNTLKIIPYDDTSAVGNGATFVPSTTPQYDLNDDDFIGDLEVYRGKVAETFNSISVEWTNRSNSYNVEVMEHRDQTSIEQYGLIKKDPIKLHSITTKAVAQTAVDAILKRAVYIRNTYKFTIGGEKYILLEPMDLVTLSDTYLGLSKVPVRLTSIEEDEDGNLMCEAEEFPFGTATATLYPKEDASNNPLNTQNDPGSIATPFLFEPPVRATQDGLGNCIWTGAYGTSVDWGGCDVYASEDNVTFRRIGTIRNRARIGSTVNTLAQASDPSAVGTVRIDISATGLTMVAASQLDCDNYRTLFYLGGELLAYRDLALFSAGVYDLTYLRRGVYATGIVSHSAAEQFCRIDDAVLELKYDPLDIGKTLYFKFPSFNTFGNMTQPLSVCSTYTLVLAGNGSGTDNAPPESIHDSLVLEGTCSLSTGTLGVSINQDAYVVTAGDRLEYDIWVDPGNPDSCGGVDIEFTDTTKLSTSTYKDQDGLSSAPSTSLGLNALGKWYHRKIDITRAATKTTSRVLETLDNSSVGFHRLKVANVRIMNGMTVKKVFWSSAVPKVNVIIYNTNYTTPKLYSQNDGGSWYALLIQGLSTGMNLQGSIIPTPSSATPFAYSTADDGAGGNETIQWTWIDVICYRPDGTTFTIPSSSKQWAAVPPKPVLTSVAGGTKASAPCWGRVGYCRDGMVVAIGQTQSITPALNQVLQFAAPGNPPVRSSSVVFSDAFTDVAATLLSAHGTGWRRTAATTNDFKIDAGGTKLQLTTAAVTPVFYLQDVQPAQSSYTVQCDVDLSASAANTDFMGLIVWGLDNTGASQGKHFALTVRGNQVLRLERQNTSVIATIGGDTAIASKVGTIKCVVTNNAAGTGVTMACYFNNTLIFTVTDTAFGAWKVGVRAGLKGGSVAAAFIDTFSIDDGITASNPLSQYDGWVPLCSQNALAGQEIQQIDAKTPLAFNVGWTEPAAGATHTATFAVVAGTKYVAIKTIGDDINANYATGFMAAASKGDVSGALATSTTYRFYPAVLSSDPLFALRMFGGAYPSVIDQTKNAQMLADLYIALANAGGMTAITGASGGAGSGGGGGCPAADHHIRCEKSSVLGTPFFNSEWIITKTVNGGKAKVTPRHPWTTKRGLVMAKDLQPLEDEIWVTMRDTGEKRWAIVESADPLREEGTAIQVVVPTEDKLYLCGAPDSTCDMEGHNLKP
jgi:hypothetical protein